MTVKRGATVLSDLGYSYTKPGTSGAAGDRVNVQTSTDHSGAGTLVPAGAVTSYGYDTLDRVTSVVEKTASGGASASWTYSYDKAGNRTQQVRAGAAGVATGWGFAVFGPAGTGGWAVWTGASAAGGAASGLVTGLLTC